MHLNFVKHKCAKAASGGRRNVSELLRNLYRSHIVVSLNRLYLPHRRHHRFILIAPYMHSTYFRYFSGHHQACHYKKTSKRRYNEKKMYILYIYTYIFQYCKKTVNLQLGSLLRFVSLYLTLDDFCVDMLDDCLRRGRNVQRSYKAQLK